MSDLLMPDITRHRRLRGVWLGAAAIAAAVLLSAATPMNTESPLADAAMRGDSTRVRLLLKQGVDANGAQADGMTALHWAAARGDVAQTRMLVSAGARLNAMTRNGHYTPLLLAAQAGRAGTVLALLNAGADAKATTSSGGATALHLAAAQGSVESIDALIAHGATADAREQAWGQTPLMWAAAYDRVSAIVALTGKGADVKLASKVENVSAREVADRASNALRNRRVAALKAAEAPVAAAGGRGAAAGSSGNVMPVSGNGPVGAGGAQQSTAPAAVATAVPATAPTSTGGAPTSSATPAGTLVPAGRGGGRDGAGPAGRDSAAPPGGRGQSYGDLVGNKGGLSAIHFAVREGHVASVLALLKAGADINQVTQGDHSSPLLLATINGQFDLAKLLVEKGANVKLASDAGATPLYATINVQWAAKSLYPQPTAQTQQQSTHLALMSALIKAGADVNARLSKHLWYMSYNFDLLGVNTAGASPFWRAAYGTDIEAMKLLVAAGADVTLPTVKPAGRVFGADGASDDSTSTADPSGLAPVPAGGPGVYPIHAATGVGYGEGFAANSHRHAPESWLTSAKYLIEVLHADVNARDFNGYTPLHHAAARGDDELIKYLLSKGADITVLSRKGQTVADMANGPVQRIPPFVETVKLLEQLGSKNSNKCKSC